MPSTAGERGMAAGLLRVWQTGGRTWPERSASRGERSDVQRIAEQLGVSEVVVVALAAFVVAQLALQVYCLVDLARRPAVTGGRKWLWALVIVFVSGVVGSILYLAVGRQVAPVDEHAALPEADSTRTTQEVIDLLYGQRSER
jgi:hypothetical protein